MVINFPAPLDQVFRALADPTRRRILEKLARQNHRVMELAADFAISQPAVTKHLDVLEGAGLITRTKKGRQRFCRLKPGALQAPFDWIDRCRTFWNDRLDAL